MADSGGLQGVHHKTGPFRCEMAAMSRIASALLIAAAVLALNAGMVRDAFAAQPVEPAARVETMPSRSAKVLSLLVILESLRQAPLALDGQKV
jgi:hypothetical protein